MKEQYFTQENIDQQTQNLLRTANGSCRLRKWQLKRNRIALLVLDLQDYFLSENSHAFIPSAPAIIDKVLDLKQLCQDYGIPIIFSRHLNTVSQARLMNHWWRELISAEDKSSAIMSRFQTADHQVIIKSQYDAFFETNLEQELRAHSVEQVIVCGVMTNLCCETTVRSAFTKGFEPFLPIDLTATYTYDYHLSTIVNLAFGFTPPVTSQQISQALRECYA